MQFGSAARKLLAAALPLFVLASCKTTPPADDTPLWTVGQVVAHRGSPTSTARTVRVRGWVTYLDTSWNVMFVQDETAGVYVAPQGGQLGAAGFGRYVELRATLKPGDGQGILSDLRVTTLPDRPLPAASGGALGGTSCDAAASRLADVRAVVLETSSYDQRLDLKLRTAAGPMTAHVRTSRIAGEGLVDAEIRISGVCTLTTNDAHQVTGSHVFVDSSDRLVVTKAATATPFGATLTTIGSLRAQRQLPIHRVHVQGRATTTGNRLRIVDGTGAMALADATLAAAPGTTLDVAGFVDRVDDELVLRNVVARQLTTPRTAAPASSRQVPTRRTLTTVADVRSLTAEDAAKSRPVSIEATVTYWDPDWKLLFVADRTGGIFVAILGETPPLRLGDRIHLAGVTAPGHFAPTIRNPTIVVRGPGTPPPPRRTRYDDIATGAEDSQWIDIEGVVRAVSAEYRHAYVDIVTSGRRIRATVPSVQAGVTPYWLIDSHVRIESVAGSQFNDDRQLTGLQLFVPSVLNIRVEDPAPVDPFGTPIRPFSSLLQFDTHRLGRRVHTRGVVTGRRAGSLYATDGRGAVELRGSDLQAEVGDEIDILGFPALGEMKPVLEDVIVRRTSHRIEPTVLTIAPGTPPNDSHHAQLVTIEGRVLDRVAGASDQVLVLQRDNVLFTAHLSVDPTKWQPPRTGSLVRVTGICKLEGDAKRSGAFRILLRSPDDAVVTRAASWWTSTHTWSAVGASALLTLAAFSWVMILRRSVRAKTSIIRERLEREAALEHRFSELIENASDPIASCDAEGRFTALNQAGADILGTSEEAAIGRQFVDFVVADHRERVVRMMASLDAGADATCEVDIGTPDGERATLELAARPLRDEGERPGFHVIGRDVTARKRLSLELERAREAAESASRAKSEFLANMSHEIRTPMNGIMGVAEVLLSTPLHEQQQEFVRMVKASADALLSVINDVLDFSKIEAGRLELDPAPFDVRAVVGDAMAPVAVQAQQKGLELTYRIAPDVPDTVVGDGPRIKQVLVNLLGNAVKFTQEGEIRVEVRLADPPPASTSDGAFTLELRVTDTGIGIPVDKHALIFDAFTQADSSTTRKFGGTGLGLTICGRLARLMGGQIGVDSAPGQGSSFWFTVTLVPAPDSRRSEAPPAGLAGRHVLVVDDNVTNAADLRELLTRWRMRPVVVDDGTAALASLADAQAQEDPFDLAVLDVHLPGADGIEVAEQLRARSALGPPVIMMLTSACGPTELQRCRELGIEVSLVKPVGEAQLLRAICRIVDGEPSRRDVGAPGAPLSVTSVLKTVPMALPAPPDRDRAASGPLRILLAEDNPVNQRVALALLAKSNHEVRVAGDGAAALGLLLRETFDLVLMDVQMPEMNGLEVTAALRDAEQATGRHLPVVAMTAHAMAGDRERCLASGMDDYVSKPITHATLTATIERVARRFGLPAPREREAAATADQAAPVI